MTARKHQLGFEMLNFEYIAVPAPQEVPKVRGVKRAEQRFAHAMSELLNAWAAEGWEFVRAESLDYEDKAGFWGRTKSGRTTLMIFRRETAPEIADPAYYAEDAPTPEELARELAAPSTPPPPAVAPVEEPAEEPKRTAARPSLSARHESTAPLRPVPGLVPDPTGRPRRG